MHERMRKMMHTEHSTMHTTIAEDSANQKWVEENCAKCTSCGVYVEHGGACDQMVCHCGEKFSFKAQQLFKVRATVGAVVMIDNLVSQTSCNGTTGIVVTALRSGRFAVNLETGTTISFHARNLVVVFDEDGFDVDGFNDLDFDEHGIHRDGGMYDEDGFDVDGFNDRGFDEHGVHRDGGMYDEDGFNVDGFNDRDFDEHGVHRDGGMYDEDGFDVDGFNVDGYDEDGFNVDGIDEVGDHEGDFYGYDEDGDRRRGGRYNDDGYHRCYLEGNCFKRSCGRGVCTWCDNDETCTYGGRRCVCDGQGDWG